MKLEALALVSLAACAREEPRASTTNAASVASVSASAASVASISASTSAVDAGAKRCLPVVAAACGCVYACGVGTESSPGAWSVVHPIWSPATLNAKIAPWCVAGDCTDAFHAEIVCSAICAPKPADHTCHFEGDRCLTGH